MDEPIEASYWLFETETPVKKPPAGVANKSKSGSFGQSVSIAGKLISGPII